MIKIAIYGKGGIGKSTTLSNISAALAEAGLRVMQIGCDPKADSTLNLYHADKPGATVLGLMRENNNDISLNDVVHIGYNGVICIESGGPTPGVGCAGRGIITALEKIEEKGIYDLYKPDVVLYDCPGDVVCGGFSMPMRQGYADKIFIVTSGENMAIYAAANIATAINNFRDRGYASLGGFIVNRRNTPHENEKVAELANDFDAPIVGFIERSELVPLAEEAHKCLLEANPHSPQADSYRQLAKEILRICQSEV